MRRAALLLIMVSGSWFASTMGVCAAEAASPLFPKQIDLDGRTFTNKVLIEAFRQTAFSPYIAPNTFPTLAAAPPYEACSFPAYDPEKVCGTPALIKERYPWLYEFVYRDEGTPRFYAINKWTGPIRISFGYPNDLLPALSKQWQQSSTTSKTRGKPHVLGGCPGPSGNPPFCLVDSTDLIVSGSPDDSDYNTAQKITEEEVQHIVPDIHALTSVAVSYVPHEQETSETFGNVRIILVRFGLANGLKNPVPLSGFASAPAMAEDAHIYAARFWALENALTTAVHFTPFNDSQVDGFFLPNADNSIGMAFCYINDRNPEPVLRALVRECVVRSLGLPGAPALAPTMILGLWNQHVPFGFLRLEPEAPHNGLADLPRVYRERMQMWGPDAPLRTPPISDFDRTMIKALYNPAVKPGMSVAEFYKLVAQ